MAPFIFNNSNGLSHVLTEDTKVLPELKTHVKTHVIFRTKITNTFTFPHYCTKFGKCENWSGNQKLSIILTQ